jgi:hypothetical protein
VTVDVDHRGARNATTGTMTKPPPTPTSVPSAPTTRPKA